MENKHSTAVVQLTKGKKNLVQIGAVCVTISIACYGLALSTLVTPILEKFHAMDYVGLFSVLGSIGITIMTLVGGRLGDIFGRKMIVVVAGIACVLFGVGIAYANSLLFLMICRTGVGVAQGAFMAAPYIIVGVINEKKDVPKAMGLLTTALAVGGFVGSIIAGFLTDLKMLKLAILFPAIPLIIGVVLIGAFYPNDKRERTGGKQPLIPMRLFREKQYIAFVVISFICSIYRGAMDVYAPLGAINVMGTSTAVAGSLQFPRTIVTIFLPVIAGAWVAKSKDNMWKAMAVATAFAAFPMLAMGFTTQSASYVVVYFIALTITGIAESFRGVSITPAAQACLKPEDIGVGTALINFANSLAGSLAAAVYGAIYGGFTAADATYISFVQKGVNAVFLTAGIITLVGLLLVVFWVRPMLQKNMRDEK